MSYWYRATVHFNGKATKHTGEGECEEDAVNDIVFTDNKGGHLTLLELCDLCQRFGIELSVMVSRQYHKVLYKPQQE